MNRLILSIVVIAAIGGGILLFVLLGSSTSQGQIAPAPDPATANNIEPGTTGQVVDQTGKPSASASDPATASNVDTGKKQKVEPGVITGRVLDQNGKPFELRYGMNYPITIIDALNDYAGMGGTDESGTLATVKLAPGKYTMFIPGKYMEGGLPSPWYCNCFPKKVDAELPDAGLNLGDIKVVRFATVAFDDVTNEVGTPITNVWFKYTDVQTTDPSLEDNRDAFYGVSSPWKAFSYTGMRIPLPPGKYSIEIASLYGTGDQPNQEKYARKDITFEVTDKDIDLGKIVLTKK